MSVAMAEGLVRGALYVLSPCGVGTLMAFLEKGLHLPKDPSDAQRQRATEMAEAKRLLGVMIDKGEVETRTVGTAQLFALRGCWV